MFKKGIIRFIKAHGIAVIAVIILALILKFVLHFSFFLSFLVLLILYFATGFVIDVISEKIRLKKARKDISKHDERSIRNRADNIPAAQDSDNGPGETIFEGVNDIDRSENGRTRSKQHLSLRKLSTDMKSIIAASPDDEKNGNRNSRSEGGSVPSGKEKRMSSSDYMRGTDFTYTRFAERNSMKAAKDNAERENVSRTSAEPDAASKVSGDPLAAAIAFDNDPAGVVSEDTALAETTAINKENDTADTAAPDRAAQEAVSAVSAAVISEIDETKDAPVTAPEQDAASGQAEGNAAQTLSAEETAEETIEEAKDARDVAPSADGTLFDSPDIDGDTRFSEGITDAVDKMLSETPKSIVRRNRYIISDKTENSENAETRGSSVNVVTDVDPGNTGKTGKAEKTDKTGYSDSEPERDVRSHISKDIDTGNTLFSVEEKDDEPEEENDEQQGKDRVNTDSSMMNAIFGGRKQEHHKKPSLEEYRRRTEKTGSARRNLTKEILEGNPSENSRESDAISLFDTEPDRGARTDIPSPVIAAVPEAAEVKEETKKEEKLPEIKRVYEIPPVDLLAGARGSDNVGVINSEDDPKAQKLISTLESFGVGAKIIGVMRGPAVTRYELQPNPGVKVSRIVALSDDIALNMASTGVRIEAPIPGKEAVGIEVPNSQVEIVSLRQVVESEEFRSSQSSLTVALGRDIAGKNIVADIAKMPHLLIAGATGSGKSVCINTIVASILFKAGPEDVRMIMIDPKIVELGVYNGIPHLLVPVVTNPKKAAGALAWAVSEMENRYTLFSEHNVRDIKAFNVLAQRDKSITKLPQILIIIDELADLMMVAAKEIEDSIIRLSQKARAAGLHIIIATQRPSVDVITGLIKANIPSRIAFAVTSQIDSRTILDGGGAEKLLGRGDMLFHPIGMAKPLRVQGAFVSDSEIEALADNVRNSYGTALYSDEIQSSIDQKDKPQGGGNSGQSDGGDDDQDADYEMIDAAAQLALEYKQLSTSFLQRKLRLGYSRASRIVDTLEAEGLISEADGSKPRQLLMSKEEWESHIAEVRGEKT